ncbi:Uncharacterized protein SCF082_LOCUS44221 [Durusdinium trenchii]|uniref:Uncharacterized protein n=1 Tax=Durusdinium trenchii TaxID=1381693 RepID=A0ABP0R0J0_9DINO
MFLVERSAFRTLVRGRAFASQSAFSDLGPTWAPMEQLQATFDEVLLRPWRFPPHVQELHRMAVLERQQRQRVVDQAPVAAERQALLARKVVYCIMGRESPRVQVCVTKVSAAQDFMERSLHELQRAAAAAQSGKLPKRRSNAAKSGLALEHPENLLLYVLESLASPDIPYHRICQERLRHWALRVRDLSTDLIVERKRALRWSR